jgi:hypothetical protein
MATPAPENLDGFDPPHGPYRSDHQTHDAGGLVLRWWPIIAMALALFFSGMFGFGKVQQDVSAVRIELTEHERSQQDTVQQMQRDLTYIRERLDRALEHQK